VKINEFDILIYRYYKNSLKIQLFGSICLHSKAVLAGTTDIINAITLNRNKNRTNFYSDEQEEIIMVVIVG
jgi:hypothetical protein